MEPLFQPGYYRDRSQSVTLVSATVVEPADTFHAVADVIGLPIRMERIDLIGAAARDIAELGYNRDETPLQLHFDVLRAVANDSDSLINRYYARIGVALLSPAVAEALTDKVKAAIAFWRDRVRRSRGERVDGFLIGRLRLFIELLSRLSARQDPTSSRAAFKLAIDLATDRDINHFRLFEPIGHLADHSIKAIPRSQRSEIVLDALQFPLSSERQIDRPFWPTPSTGCGIFGWSDRRGIPAGPFASPNSLKRLAWANPGALRRQFGWPIWLMAVP